MLEASKEKPSDHIKTLSTTSERMFRNLEKHQQLYCSRTIMEALYQAALGNFHEDSHKALEVRKEIFNCDPVRVDDSSPDVTNESFTHNIFQPLNTNISTPTTSTPSPQYSNIREYLSEFE